MQFDQHIVRVLAAAADLGEDGPALVAANIKTPPRPELGDVAFPCFPLAKILRRAPNQIAQQLVERIRGDELIDRAVAQGPFVNLFLKRGLVAHQVLGAVHEQGEAYGRQDVGQGGVVVLDYSHPNIAKPFHIGHLRSTNLGAAMARIFATVGYRPFRKNYLGDWGTQFGYVIYAWQKYGEEEALRERAVSYLVELYVRANQEAEEDETIRDQARDLFRRLEEGDPEIHALWARFREMSIENYQLTYRRLGVAFDSYEGEASISAKIPEVVQRFRDAGLARESEGALVVDVAETIGKDVPPCMLLKSDGSSTYGTRDCAEALYRWENHAFALNLYVVARQDLHFAQVFAALHRLAQAEGWETDWTDRCEVAPFGFVKGMSTRKGEVVWLEDVLDEACSRAKETRLAKQAENPKAFPAMSAEDQDAIAEAVGLAAILHFDVSAQRVKDVTFDWDTVLHFEGRTGPYLQYGHARIAGLFRKAEAMGIATPERCIATEDADRLLADQEWALVRALERYPAEILRAAEAREPNFVARYLYELCSALNSFYAHCKVLDPSAPELSQARLQLVAAVRTVIANGLALLGIQAPEVM